MRNVAWTLAILTIVGLVAATAHAAGPWGPPGPARVVPGPVVRYDWYGYRAPYPAYHGAVVVARPVYVAPPRAYVPPPPPPAVYPPPVVYPAPVYPPPAYYGPGVGIQYFGRNFGISVGF